MKKKIFAVALAAVMTVSSVVSAFAFEPITGGWWTAWTPGTEVKDSVEFDIEVKGGDSNWNNLSAVFASVMTDGAAAPNDTEGYKEYAVVRADSWGWGGGDNKSVDGNDIVYESTLTDLDGDGDVWTDFRAAMKDAHIDATVTKTADGIKLEYKVTGANGTTFDYTATTVVDTSAGLYVFFACDGSEVTVTPVTAEAPAEDDTKAPATDATTKAPAKDSPATGDATATAAMVVVAFAAAAAVVVLKKRAVNE